MARRVVYITKAPREPYGFWNFAGDAFLTIMTGGLWFIWIFVREMRNR